MKKNRVKVTREEMQRWDCEDTKMRFLKSLGVPMQGLRWHSAYSYRTETNRKTGAQTIIWSRC